jgi:hypothetical protein
MDILPERILRTDGLHPIGHIFLYGPLRWRKFMRLKTGWVLTMMFHLLHSLMQRDMAFAGRIHPRRPPMQTIDADAPVARR